MLLESLTIFNKEPESEELRGPSKPIIQRRISFEFKNLDLGESPNKVIIVNSASSIQQEEEEKKVEANSDSDNDAIRFIRDQSPILA